MKRMGREQERKLIEQALQRWAWSSGAEYLQRSEMLLDVACYLGDQWDPQDRQERASAGRPCETVNIVQQFVRQVTNQQRQTNNAITIHPELPGDSEAETAEIIQGLTRHIEQSSHADVAYETAFQQMAISGIGWYELDIVPETQKAWKAKVIIRPIMNQFSVYDDPAAVRYDRRDSKWRFITEDVPWEDAKQEYGDELITDDTFANSLGDEQRLWWTEHTVRIANYWYIKMKKGAICLMQGGESRWWHELTDEEKPFIVNWRPETYKQVCWAKMTAAQVLDHGEWPGQWLPQIPMIGDETLVSGERIIKGMVRNARSPQRRYNYLVTTLTELFMMIPKAPVVGAAGQFENREMEWAGVNNKPLGYLEYNPISVAGTLVPAPTRISYSADIEKAVIAIQQCEGDVRAAMGMYQASLGKRERDESGVALRERKMAGDMANLNYADNEARAIQAGGEMIVDLIPHVYDTARIVQILRPNGKSEPVLINHAFRKGQEQKIFDLRSGAFGVAISAAPGYLTMQEQRQDMLIKVADLAMPDQKAVIVPEIIRVTDFPGNMELAEKLDRGLPPQYQDNGTEADLSPQAKRIVDALTQQNQMLQQEVQGLSEVVKNEQVKADSQERIQAGKNQVELAKTQANIVIEQAKIDAGNTRALMAAEFNKLQNQMDVIGQRIMADEAHERALEMGAVQHQQAQQLQLAAPEEGAEA